MRDFADMFQRVSLMVCLAALAAIALGYMLYAMGDGVARLRRLFGSSKVQGVLATIAIVGAVMYGGSKGVNVRWDTGLYDNGTEITNNTVAVRWAYSGIPSASAVYIDYREAGSTNEWGNLGESVASALSWTGTLANATNYEYWVYSTYVPPVPVHTNGVWVGQAYETKARVGAKSFLVLNGKIIKHGRTIAPPVAKRRDVPYDSEVEYLESTGTPWIDTAVQNADKVQMGLWVNRTGGDMKIWGNSYYLGAWADVSWFQSKYRDTQIEQVAETWDVVTIEKSPRKLTVRRGSDTFVASSWWSANGSSTTTSQIGTAVPLFGHINPYGTVAQYGDNRVATWVTAGNYYRLRISSFRAWDGNRIIRDLVPVRVGTVGCMYDRVSEQLFGNKVTGSFIVGTDK